jgi:diguanylate cyclase (GGDEF)-like protein/PAS domain S-box-containing protein
MTDQLLHRLVLEALPLGIYVVNREGKVVLWSEGAEKLTGFLRQDIVGRSCQEELLKHCDEENNPLEGATIPLLATLREGRPATGLLSLRVKNGHFLPVQLQTVPLRDDRGSLVGAAELFEPVAKPSRDDRRQSKLNAYGCVDTLTGVLNHSMIQAHVKESLSLHLVYPVPFSVMCFAIDELAELRKRFGQAGADAALRSVAQTVENALRPTDFVGRWLEAEFLAILTECDEGDAAKVGERLCRMVRNTGVPWWGDKIRVSVSIGATAAIDNDTVGSLVSRAEQGLRESQEGGGNRVVAIGSQE